MALRKYDMVDLELIKKAPRRLGEDGYRALGVAEFWIRERQQWPQHVLVMIHSYLRNAHEAYARNGMASPWVQGYERRPPPEVVSPVAVAPVLEVPLPKTMRPATVELHQQILGYVKQFGGKAALWRLKLALNKLDVDEAKVDRAVQNLMHEGYLEATGRGYYKLGAKVDEVTAKDGDANV